MRILITGGTGFLGAELARLLVARGDEVVLFDLAPDLVRISDFKDDVKLVHGNLAYASEVYNAARDSHVERIVHLGSMLSVPSNANPWASFQVNVVGTMNVLEAARLFGIEQVLFCSTLATYGIGCGTTATDETIQRPTTMYGSGKLYGESLGRFYRTRFGLDFRSVRFPSVMGPGAKVKHVSQYNAWMVEYPALGKPFECFVAEGTKSPAIYFKDAVRALDMVCRVPRESIETVNYNVAGIAPTPTAKELEQAVRKHVPGAMVTYAPEPAIMEYYKTMRIEVMDDSRARQEWGWSAQYSNLDATVQDFLEEMRNNPARYGLK